MIKKIPILILLFINFLSAQQVVDNITVTGTEQFKESQILQWIALDEGDLYNANLVKSSNQNIIKELNKSGYLYARIDGVSTKTDTGENRIRLNWKIAEGPLCKIGNIQFEYDSLWIANITNNLNLKSGDIFNQKYIESEILYITRQLANKGFPFPDVSITDINPVMEDENLKLDIIINIKTGKPYTVDQILVRGNEVTKDKVILRELDFNEGELYQQDKIEQIRQKLNRLGFLKRVEEPVPVMNENNNLALIIELEEGNSTSFDGVVGYVPEQQQAGGSQGYFTGLINAGFLNPFGSGRKFEIFWEKQDEFSEQFRLYYEEPWILNYPVNAGVGLERLVKDTTYIQRTYFINSIVRYSSELRFTLSLQNTATLPDSAASRDLGLLRNFITTIESGIEYDTRDYRTNPRSGLLYYTRYSFGLKENTGPSYLLKENDLKSNEELQKLQIGLAYFQPLWKNQVLAFNTFAGRIKSNESQLQITDHFWFGGAKNVRGYRENQYHGNVVAWVNTEYRFLIGRDSRIFLFNDWGFYRWDKKEEVLPGYGIGIRFETALGVMGFDYGLGKDDTFSNGKIHFGIENRF